MKVLRLGRDLFFFLKYYIIIKGEIKKKGVLGVFGAVDQEKLIFAVLDHRL